MTCACSQLMSSAFARARTVQSPTGSLLTGFGLNRFQANLVQHLLNYVLRADVYDLTAFADVISAYVKYLNIIHFAHPLYNKGKDRRPKSIKRLPFVYYSVRDVGIAFPALCTQSFWSVAQINRIPLQAVRNRSRQSVSASKCVGHVLNGCVHQSVWKSANSYIPSFLASCSGTNCPCSSLHYSDMCHSLRHRPVLYKLQSRPHPCPRNMCLLRFQYHSRIASNSIAKLRLK